MGGSLIPDPLWSVFERDHWLRREFVTLHMDPEVCVLLVAAAVLKHGEPTTQGDAFAAPRWGVERWIEARTGIGPNLARQVVLVATDPRFGGQPDCLRLRAGRVEIALPKVAY